MSSDQDKTSYMIVVSAAICRAEESPFLEVEKPMMQSLSLTRLKSWKLSHIVNFKASGSMTMSVSSVTQLCPSLRPPWTVVCQASLSITNSQSLLKLMSIESLMLYNYSSSVFPFSSHLQSFPASESFPISQFFASGGQSIICAQIQSAIETVLSS